MGEPTTIIHLDEMRWARAVEQERKDTALRMVQAYERVHGRLPQSDRELAQVIEWFSSTEGQLATGLLPDDPKKKAQSAHGKKLLDAFERAHSRTWDKNFTELRRFAEAWLATPEGRVVAAEIEQEGA
jgi:hypothetical protein